MAGRDAYLRIRYECLQALLFFEISGYADAVVVSTWVALCGNLLPDPGAFR